MKFPLVRELAEDGIPVTVTCRVLSLCRQQYYRWLKEPITTDQLDQAHVANAVFDAHRDDPEFGYRFLADEARYAGHEVSDRTVWKICSEMGWWSVFGKKKSRKAKQAGTPAHDDLVRRVFTAARPNELWLTDITEHATSEGKIYLCAIKDVFSNRIVGYSISDRMQAQLAVDALETAVARRGGDVAACLLHSDRGSQFRSRKLQRALTRHDMVGSMGQVGSAADNAGDGIVLLATPKERAQPTQMGYPRRAPNRDHHLDRTHLPPALETNPAREANTNRIRVDHDPNSSIRCLNQTCHQLLHQTH